jgi:hypothetical protein
LQTPCGAAPPAAPTSPGCPSLDTRLPRERQGKPLGFALRASLRLSKLTASFPGRCPSGERCSSHSAPGGMVAPGELVFCLPKRQVCQEQTWTREARPKGSHQGGCESAKPKKRAPGWRADPARRRLEPGATEGTSLCLCRRTRSLACPFGRFRLKPTMLGRAIRDDSVVP